MMVRGGWTVAACLSVLASAMPAGAESVEELRRELRELLDRARALERRIDTLEQDDGGAPRGAAAPDAALDAAIEAAREETAAVVPATPDGRSPLASTRLGGVRLTLIDVSIDVLAAVGGSTERDETIETLQGGAHDPRRRGFTLQQAELAFRGAVDPYFTAEAYVIATDEEIELEEAFFTTTGLPWGLELEGGHFFTEFGRINPVHPHAWTWLDQPVINSRLFGGEGLRNPGARVGWLVPVPWYAQLHVGAQSAAGDTARSFFGEGEEDDDEDDHGHGEGFGPVGGFEGDRDEVRGLDDLLYLTRLETGGDLGRGVSALVGGSALFGPNATGRRTYIWGGDVTLKWRPATNFRGWPFLVWQSEVMGRRYHAPSLLDESGRRVAGGRLDDWGVYTQALVGFRYGWAGGLRYEFAGGSGQSVDGRAEDPARADRHRLAPLLTWHPSEFARIRLQYNYDQMRLLESGDAHSLWLGVEVLYGAHPAHAY